MSTPSKPRLVELSIDTIPVGLPLQFALRDSNGVLLANRGYTIESREHLERLNARGIGLAVDIEETGTVHRAYMMRLNKMVVDNTCDIKDIVNAKMHAEDMQPFEPATVHGGYPDFWSYQTRANALLRNPDPTNFVKRIDEMQRDLRYFSNKFPEVTLTAVVHLAAREMRNYSAMHALLVWVVVTMTARFALKWDEGIVDSLGKAALTMNISMTDMQDRMAHQNWPLTTEQANLVENHPMLSRRILENLGVMDPLWLQAVEEHRDQVPGPLAKKTVAQQLGRLIQRADVFGARLAPRLHRQPMPITAAMQASYLDEDRQPDDAGTAIVRTLGVYSPGSYVRLITGEIGIVVRRQLVRPGAMGKYPVVLVVLNREGFPVPNSIERDTSSPTYRIEGAVSAKDISRVTVPLEKLLKASDNKHP